MARRSTGISNRYLWEKDVEVLHLCYSVHADTILSAAVLAGAHESVVLWSIPSVCGMFSIDMLWYVAIWNAALSIGRFVTGRFVHKKT